MTDNDEMIQEVLDNFNIRVSSSPWWTSGAACLSAVMWLAWLTLLFLSIFGLVERDYVLGFSLVLLLVVAIIAGAMAHGGKKRND